MNKEPSEWTDADLRALITSQTQESLVLEYKRSDSLRRDDKSKDQLSIDVSAFANSAGGTIVYGVAEDKRLPTAVDGGVDPRDISKEWFEQVLNSRIQRRIDGVRINPILLSGVSSGRVAYVVSIPESLRAPHMAGDHRYYKRFNFQSVPMEDYEVRDVGRRSQAPDLTVSLRLQPELPKLEFSEGDEFSSPIQVAASISNASPEPAQYLVVFLIVDARLRIANKDPELREAGTARLEFNGHGYDCRKYSLNWSVPGKLPVWQDMPFQLVSNLGIGLPKQLSDFALGWQVSAPAMQRRMAFYVVRPLGDHVRLICIQEP